MCLWRSISLNICGNARVVEWNTLKTYLAKCHSVGANPTFRIEGMGEQSNPTALRAVALVVRPRCKSEYPHCRQCQLWLLWLSAKELPERVWGFDFLWRRIWRDWATGSLPVLRTGAERHCRFDSCSRRCCRGRISDAPAL